MPVPSFRNDINGRQGRRLSRKLRNIKPRKVNRGAFEERTMREENHLETQRALMVILPLLMLAVLAVGVFFGYKYYLTTIGNRSASAPSEPVNTDELLENPLFLRAVNSASPLSGNDVPELVESCGIMISPEVAPALERMVSDGRREGFEFLVQQGYISYEEQSERYDKAVKDYRKKNSSSLVMAEAHVKREIPRAGESEQQTGLVVYLTVRTDGKFVDTAAYAWLLRNCVDYGFVLRYPDNENTGGMAFNSHLFRYVGTEYARNMRELDMSFDAFIHYLAAH